MVVRTPHETTVSLGERVDTATARGRAEEASSLLVSTTRMLVAARDDDPDRLRVYAELAGELLDRAPPTDRALVAALLADFPPAPRAILRRLARDDYPIAAPILARAASLTAIDLLGLLAVVPESHAAVIAGREGLALDVMFAVINRGEVGPTRALLANPRFQLTSAFADALAAIAHDDPVILATLGRAPVARREAIVPLFGALDTAARAKIIATLEARRVLQSRPSRAPARVVSMSADDLFSLATKGAWGEIAKRMADALDVEIERIDVSLEDAGGEPLLVLLRAVGLAPSDAMRVLLFHAKLGRDVAKIRWLGELNERLTSDGALLLVDDWRGRERARTAHEINRAVEPAEGVRRPQARPVERPMERPIERPADRAIAILRARLG